MDCKSDLIEGRLFLEVELKSPIEWQILFSNPRSYCLEDLKAIYSKSRQFNEHLRTSSETDPPHPHHSGDLRGIGQEW